MKIRHGSVFKSEFKKSLRISEKSAEEIWATGEKKVATVGRYLLVVWAYAQIRDQGSWRDETDRGGAELREWLLR